MELAQDWLRFHLGRKGGRRMSAADLVARHKRIDDEVKQLATKEEAAALEPAGDK
jgi:hypothetical protein